LYAPQRARPAARGWDGPESFPRTSGTGRLAGGGFFWTDYLYDDHGATSASAGQPAEAAGTPSFGTYTYPAGPAANNGADIFTAAVLLRDGFTSWRVDWTTLKDAAVPIAEWTFDRDADPATGASAWPAGAGVSSPGIDTALVVSSRVAQLIDTASSRVLARLPVSVDLVTHSFIVKVPSSVLRPTGRWRIRLAAGLADSTGTRFASANGALPGEPAVYNVTFRGVAQEPPTNNFWSDSAQAHELTLGAVTPFSATLDWSDLAARKATREARPTGWSNRWYVSSVKLGDGVQSGFDTISSGDAEFLGRVQPYAVYVPTAYKSATPAPLTWLLHSSTQNHNQYAATTPRLGIEACERRASICLSPLGRGPEGDFWDYAELDFWEVWRDAAEALRLDPDRTALVGYSMGGLGVNQLAMEHPDLFARAITLAGGVGDVPQAASLRWVPVYLAGGVADELVPLTLEAAEAERLAQLGYRYRWLVYPAEDHVTFSLKDGFSDAVAYIGDGVRMVNPGRVTFVWTPHDTRGDANTTVAPGPQGHVATTQMPGLGVGTTGAYWVRDLAARSKQADAAVDAESSARPRRVPVPTTTRSLLVPGTPTPAIVTEQAWEAGVAAPRRAVVALRLTNISSLTVLLHDAGFRPGSHGTMTVDTDGATAIRVGERIVRVGKGTSTIDFRA
jgi:hypothetical protein